MTWHSRFAAIALEPDAGIASALLLAFVVLLPAVDCLREHIRRHI